MEKPLRKWLIAYFNESGEVVRPVYEQYNTRKPTGWAIHTYPNSSLTFKIREVEAFSEDGYSDDFIKSWEGEAHPSQQTKPRKNPLNNAKE